MSAPVLPRAPAPSSALERAVERFGGLVLRVGRARGLSDADLDEILQEVRIRLWRARGEPETLDGLGTSYVYRTAVTAALDVLRRRRAARTGVDATLELTASLPDARSNPAEAAEYQELQDRVYVAVEGLQPSRRVVVRMHLLGYDRRAIAQALGWTEGKVRNLLSRGLADLRERLEADGVGPEGIR